MYVFFRLHRGRVIHHVVHGGFVFLTLQLHYVTQFPGLSTGINPYEVAFYNCAMTTHAMTKQQKVHFIQWWKVSTLPKYCTWFEVLVVYLSVFSLCWYIGVSCDPWKGT